MPYQSGFRANLLEDRTILIPGGGGGLGRCIAHEVTALGASVILAGRSMEKLHRTRSEITADGGRVLSTHSVELRDESAVVTLIEQIVAEHGPIHALANAAGGQFPAKLADLSLNGWNAVLNNNLTSYFLVAREVYRQSMQAHGGSIVHIGADWENGMAGMGHNGAARAGLSNLTYTSATEWGRDGVRVNCVIPGFIATKGLDRYPQEDWQAIAAVDRRIPLGRHGLAAEISSMVVFLLSDLAAYVTGADFRVDGGIHNGAGSFVFEPHPMRNVRRFEGFHRDEPPDLLK